MSRAFIKKKIMTEHQIKRVMTQIKSKNDFLALINTLKKEEKGEDVHPFTARQFRYFINPHNLGRYKTFTIPKKNGGERIISAPVPVLRSMLHYVNMILSSMYLPKSCVMGFTQGRCVVDNANIHTRQNYVLNLDLHDFFTSIDQARVWKRIQVNPYNISKDVSSAIAGLCSIAQKTDDGKVRNVLPQGSPASPVLTNMICERLDNKLMKLARTYNVKYSRYADDMTFSSMHNVYQKDGEFLSKLYSIIEDEGFVINEKKTRLQKRGSRQDVTGLNVAEHPNVTRNYVNWLRTILYVWERYGYGKAYEKFYPMYKSEKGHTHKGEPNMENVISGKLLYMKMVKGSSDPTYSKLQRRFDILVESIREKETDNSNSINYLQSYTIKQFEKVFNTQIVFDIVDAEHYAFSCFIGNNKIVVRLSRKNNPKNFVSYLIDLHNQKDEVSRTYYISLCEGQDERVKRSNIFWLVTSKKPKHIKGSLKVNLNDIIEVWEKEGIAAAINKLGIIENDKNVESRHHYPKVHNPKEMTKSLYKFSSDAVLKWFTHTPDSTECDIKSLLDMNSQRLADRLRGGRPYVYLNINTWNNIKRFLIGSDDKKSRDAYDKEICLSWASKEVRKWCVSHPNEHPYYAQINGERFSDFIMDFKHSIEFRTDDEDMTFKRILRSYIYSIDENEDLDIDFTEEFMEKDNVSLFIDVRLLLIAIKKIFSWILSHKDISNNVDIDITEKETYYELSILHKGSRLALNEEKKKGLSGDMAEVRATLWSVADFYMDADQVTGNTISINFFPQGCKAETQGQYYEMKTECETKELDNPIGGVKYRIIMYKNC